MRMECAGRSGNPSATKSLSTCGLGAVHMSSGSYPQRLPQTVQPSHRLLSGAGGAAAGRGSLRTVALILLDAGGEFGDLVVDRAALLHELADLLVRIHDGRVIAVAEQLPDLRQREARHLAAQVHRDLARGRDGLRTR